jgi:hypothetical protein
MGRVAVRYREESHPVTRTVVVAQRRNNCSTDDHHPPLPSPAISFLDDVLLFFSMSNDQPRNLLTERT